MSPPSAPEPDVAELTPEQRLLLQIGFLLGSVCGTAATLLVIAGITLARAWG